LFVIPNKVRDLLFPYFLISSFPNSKGESMSTKHHTESHCQYKNSRGQRCRMLIDKNHSSPGGEKRSSLCPYHLAQTKAKEIVPDPENLAAELLGELEDFSTADAVNHFLGNLVKQLARKRIARRDAIALAYLGQLLLNSLPLVWKEIEDEQDTAAGRDLLQGLARDRAARLSEQQSPEPASVQTNPS
jgi:hypothetical protein